MHAMSGTKIYTSATFALLFSVYGCSDPSVAQEAEKSAQAADKNNGNSEQFSNSLDPESWAERLLGLKSSAAKIANDANETNTQLLRLFEVKNSLCSRQAQLFSSCIVHAPLSPSTWRSGAACRVEHRAWDNRAFKVRLSGVSGRFRFVLDNFIESNAFDAGEERALTWTSTGNRNLRDLKLSDIGSVKLKMIEGSLPNLENAKLVFKVDEKVLLTQEQFLLDSQTDTAVILSPIPLFEALNSNDCHVEDNELDVLSKEAIARAPLPEVVKLPNENKEASKEVSANQFEDWINLVRRDLQARADVFLAVAQDISRLRRDLRGDLQLGCWSKEVIRNIEIEIKGIHLPLSDWDRAAVKKQLSNIGNPTQTTIDFGGGLRFSNPDEKSLALFREDGRWLLNATTDLTIGDINSIQIQKGGVGYQHFKNCWSTWKGLGTACEWQNRETDRYQLTAMAVKVNGQRIYQKDGINHALQRGSLNWIEKELTANPAYIDLMRRRDCPIQNSAW